jgi:glycosyltransferase involved in cell wall biosynthesis
VAAVEEIPRRALRLRGRRRDRAQSRGQAPAVALIPWGNVLEDFLEPNGLTLDEFRTAFTGSWMFAWIEALRRRGVRTVLVCVTNGVRRPERTVHAPSSVGLWLLPPPRAYRVLAGRMRNPYGRTVAETFRTRTLLSGVARELAPYLATPPIALARVLRAERCRTLLLQEYEFPRFDVCALLGPLARVRVFATFQGGDYRRWRLERVTRPLAMRACAGVVVGPRSEAERVRRMYGVRATRIFNPVDLDTWKPGDRAAARRELGLPQDAQVVAWHGRVALDQKGLDILLHAWARVSRTGPERRLLLIGTGRDVAALRALGEELGVAGVVHVDRYVHDRDVLSRWLSAANVYAFPSRHEGLPVAPIEAMACGLPVVGADASGVADVLGAGAQAAGLLVPAGDPEVFAAALARLLADDALRARLAANALRRARERFSLDATGARLRDVLLPAGSPPWSA